MRAQRAHQAVNSYEGQRPLMSLLVGADEVSVEEARIGVKGVGSNRACAGVFSSPAEGEVDLAHNALEVADRGRVAALRMRAERIGRKSRAVDRSREVEMDTERRRRREFTVWNRKRDPDSLTPLRVVGEHRQPEAGANSSSGTSGSSYAPPDEAAA